MKLNSREIATVLAALRYYQSYTTMVDRGNDEHFGLDELEPMDDLEIDSLCEKINVREP